MWIRSVEWRSGDGAVDFRGATPVREDGLADGVEDASNIRETLTRVAELASEGPGEWVLELVGATPEDRETLGGLIEPLAEGQGDDLATYLVADHASPGGIYEVKVSSTGEREIEPVRNYRVGHLCRVLPPTDSDDAPLLYVTRVRIIAQADFLLVNWMIPGGYPTAPDPRRVKASRDRILSPDASGVTWPRNIAPGGPEDAARAAGVPDEVIAFEFGPHTGLLRRIGWLDGVFAATPTAPRRLAEHLIAQLASSMVHAADECAGALQAWEAGFMTSTTGDRNGAVAITSVDSYRQLAGIANLVGAVRNWTDELNSPANHDPVQWFAHTPDSERALESLESADRRLERAREDYRTALTVAAAIATSQQLELQSLNQAQGQAFERTVALAGSIVLVPGLVATFYGTNVPLPVATSWWGTVLVAVLMVLSGCATWLLLSRLRTERSS